MPFYLKIKLNWISVECLYFSVFTSEETNKFPRVTITVNNYHAHRRKTIVSQTWEAVVLWSVMQVMRPIIPQQRYHGNDYNICITDTVINILLLIYKINVACVESLTKTSRV
jgi:hypothetical protein